MEREDFQLLRYAALEMQASNGDLVRIAGAWQKIKDWWSVRKNRKALKDIKLPVEESFRQLDAAIRGHDTETVERISNELPVMLAQSIKGIDKIRDSMLVHPTNYTGKDGEDLAGDNLSWVTKNYRKEKSLVEKLWEMLPEAFRSEIPVGKRVGQPISNFSWYKTYSPNDIYISPTVKDNLWKSLSRLFDGQTLEYIAPGYDQFLENIKSAIINDSILVQVNFSPVSSQVERRRANEMRVEVIPPEVAFPIKDSELFIHIDKVIFTDLGTRVSPKHQLSVLGIWPSVSNKIREFKVPVTQSPQSSEGLEPQTAAEGPITKIIKNSLLKKALPNTQAVIKIDGKSFDYKVRFAKILSSALRQELDAECSVRNIGDEIEVQADVCGSKLASLSAIFGISKYLVDKFSNINNIDVNIGIRQGISNLEIISTEVLDNSFRKIAFDLWGMK